MHVLDDDGADVPEPADPAGLDHHELVEAILHAPLPARPPSRGLKLRTRPRLLQSSLSVSSLGDYEASKQGRPLTTMITVHPGRMESRPKDPGLFFRRVVRNHVEIWLKRRKVSRWAIWTRENYEGEDRAVSGDWRRRTDRGALSPNGSSQPRNGARRSGSPSANRAEHAVIGDYELLAFDLPSTLPGVPLIGWELFTGPDLRELVDKGDAPTFEAAKAARPNLPCPITSARSSWPPRPPARMSASSPAMADHEGGVERSETTVILRGQVQRYIVPDDQFWRCPVIREQRVRDGETTQECPHLGDAVTREVDTARSP